jgi:hypothetical protein
MFEGLKKFVGAHKGGLKTLGLGAAVVTAVILGAKAMSSKDEEDLEDAEVVDQPTEETVETNESTEITE